MALTQIVESTIAQSHYAPEGASDIKLYNYNGAEGLTIAQLVSAVCIRRAAQLERVGVMQMNELTNMSDKLTGLSNIAQEILTAEMDVAVPNWTQTRQTLIDEYGCSADDLPADITKYKNRMTAYSTIEKRMTSLNNYSDRMGIDLQTTMSRRDVVLTTASTTVKHLGVSALGTAAAMYVRH